MILWVRTEKAVVLVSGLEEWSGSFDGPNAGFIEPERGAEFGVSDTVNAIGWA